MNYPNNVNTIEEKIEFVKAVYGIEIDDLFNYLLEDLRYDIITKASEFYKDSTNGASSYDLINDYHLYKNQKLCLK